MSSSLIYTYLSGGIDLASIQAIAHWASQNLKEERLSIKDCYDTVGFVKAINSNTTVHYNKITNKNDRISHTCTQEILYVNAFLFVFAEFDNKADYFDL